MTLLVVSFPFLGNLYQKYLETRHYLEKKRQSQGMWPSGQAFIKMKLQRGNSSSTQLYQVPTPCSVPLLHRNGRCFP